MASYGALVQGDAYRDFLATLPVLKEKVTKRPTCKSVSVGINYGVFARLLAHDYFNLSLKDSDAAVDRWAPGMYLKAVRYECCHRTEHGFLQGSCSARVVFEYSRRSNLSV